MIVGMEVGIIINGRVVSILLIAIVGMMIIVSQSPVAFAGFIDGDNDGFENLLRECIESDLTCDPDDSDPCNPNPSSKSCIAPPPIEIKSDVKDGIVVGPGDVVIISNSATVDGNVEVNGGTLVISESSTIKGNLESNGGTIVIEDSKIEGNVKIEVSGAGGVLEIDGGEINGTVETNGIDTLTITNSNINGNISSENDSDVTITGNTVNGNLEIIDPSSCSESSNNVNGNNSGCP